MNFLPPSRTIFRTSRIDSQVVNQGRIMKMNANLSTREAMTIEISAKNNYIPKKVHLWVHVYVDFASSGFSRG